VPVHCVVVFGRLPWLHARFRHSNLLLLVARLRWHHRQLEIMLQQNFEANERKCVKVSEKEMRQKAILYRLASWPNLTQLTFMYSIPFGGLAWLQQAQTTWPMQSTPMYHYGMASALGYALSMFSETLRDRKLVTLDQDLLILIIGFCFPMVSVIIDGLTYGSAVSINPAEYWALFGFGT